MKKVILVFFAIVSTGLIFLSCSDDNSTEPQGNDISWIKTFGGTGDEIGTSTTQTNDGYIVTGYTNSYGAGNYDAWLIKIDPNGNEIWSKTFGGSNLDWASSVEKTSDGGYVFAGGTESYGNGQKDIFFVKTDSVGNEIWAKTFGGINDDQCNCLKPTTDGGYILVGETKSFGSGENDVYLIKTDSDGNQVWSKTFGGISYDWGSLVQQTTDEGYIITGTTDSFGSGYQVLLIKTDSNGNEIWSKTFGNMYFDSGSSVQQTTDGGYIITGSTGLSETNDEVYLVKTDSNGNLAWSKKFGGNSFDYGNSVKQTVEGGYIISGIYGSVNKSPFYDVYLIKTSSNGSVEWSKTFGGSGDEVCGSVEQTSGGGYIIAGSVSATTDDLYLIKTDENGYVNN